MTRRFILLTILCLAAMPAVGQVATGSGNERFIYATVTNKSGEWIGGLTAANFKISDGKNIHPISSFTFAEEPVTVGILIDISGSSEKLMTAAYEALTTFVNSSAKGTEYFVMTFNVTQQLLLDRTENTPEVLTMLKKTAQIQPKANTALFEAIDAGLNKISEGKYAKKVLIVFSDGTDNVSKISFNDLRRKVRRSDVLIYNFNAQNPYDALPPYYAGSNPATTIDELTLMTGGRSMYVADRTELHLASSRTAEELRRQYKIGFRPRFDNQKVKLDDWRNIEVKLELPDDARKSLGKVSLRTRRGYYPDPASVK